MNRQNGVSLTGFLFVCGMLVVVAILAMKIVPAYTEYKDIKTDLQEIARNPDMQDATDDEIRHAFERKAAIDDITAISARDIDITRDPLNLHVKYIVDMPIMSNFSLHLNFEANAKGLK